MRNTCMHCNESFDMARGFRGWRFHARERNRIYPPGQLPEMIAIVCLPCAWITGAGLGKARPDDVVGEAS